MNTFPNSRRIVCEKLLFLSFASICTSGFIYGTVKVWRKYQSEPLSSTTFEVDIRNEVLPSFTVCPYILDAFSVHESYSLEDIVEELGSELIHVSLGQESYA